MALLFPKNTTRRAIYTTAKRYNSSMMMIAPQQLFDYTSKPTVMIGIPNKNTTKYRTFQTIVCNTTTTTILSTTSTTRKLPFFNCSTVWNGRHLNVRCLNTDTTKSESSSQTEEEPCPEWQNPILHKRNLENADSERIMLGEYTEEEEPPIIPLPPFGSNDGGVIASPHLHELAEEIVVMNMMEVKELLDRIAIHFGIDETSEEEEVAAVEGDSGENTTTTTEEQTHFSIKLQSFDAKSKIKVIKEVRSITSLGLKESKALVEGAPKIVTQDLSKEEAEKLKEKLESIGAIIEIV